MSSDRASPNILIERKMIMSPVFQKLSGTAKTVLLLFLARRRFSKTGRKGKEKWVISNNGEIVFPYSEAKKKFGISCPQFQRSLDRLIHTGFIDISHHGGGMLGDTTTYFISKRWKNHGTDRFISKSRPKDTRGLGFTAKERTAANRNKKSKATDKNVSGAANKNVSGKRKNKPLLANKNVSEGTSVNSLSIQQKQPNPPVALPTNKNVSVL